MRSKLISGQAQKTWAVVFQTGDEVMAGLTQFAKEHNLRNSHFTAIGAFSDATIAYFEWQKKEYKRIPVHEQVEVLTLAGDIALKDGQPKVHMHVVLGREDGTTRGGHLMEGYVRPTLEVMLTEMPEPLRRRYDPESGLALIDPGASGEGRKPEEIP